jgi:quinol monooxygenase YgiN
MIRHIVMWKLRQFADAQHFKHLLESCRGIVPGMTDFEVGIRCAQLEATQDVVLFATFSNRTALDAYLAHPHHQSIAKVLGQMRTAREVLDYDLEASRHHDVAEDPQFFPTVLQPSL